MTLVDITNFFFPCGLSAQPAKQSRGICIPGEVWGQAEQTPWEQHDALVRNGHEPPELTARDPSQTDFL